MLTLLLTILISQANALTVGHDKQYELMNRLIKHCTAYAAHKQCTTDGDCHNYELFCLQVHGVKVYDTHNNPDYCVRLIDPIIGRAHCKYPEINH